VTDAGGLATPHCGNADESMKPREICRLTERTLAIRQSPCVGKRMEGMRDGVEDSRRLMCYSYRQQGEATFSQDVASSNVLPPSDA
jgi:hypothetical protein